MRIDDSYLFLVTFVRWWRLKFSWQVFEALEATRAFLLLKFWSNLLGRNLFIRHLFLLAAFFNTVVQACYNLQLAQIFLRLSYSLSPNQRRQLLASIPSVRPSVAKYVCDIVESLDKTGLYLEVKLFCRTRGIAQWIKRSPSTQVAGVRTRTRP